MDTAASFKTNAEFDQWLQENEKQIMAYVKENDVQIKDLPMAPRAYNTLRLKGYHSMGQFVMGLPPEIPKESVLGSVVYMLRRDYLREHRARMIAFVGKNSQRKNEEAVCEQPAVASEMTAVPSQNDGKALLCNAHTRAAIMQQLQTAQISIEEMNLSVRSYNCLKRAGLHMAHQVLERYPDGYLVLRNMGRKSENEICSTLEKMAAEIAAKALNGEENPMPLLPEKIDDPESLTVLELLAHPQFREKACKCLQEIDTPVEAMGLSVRATGALKRADRYTLSAILPVYPDGIGSLKNIGAKTVAEIQEQVEYYLEKLQPIVAAYCAGTGAAYEEVMCDVMYTDEYITGKIVDCFKNSGFTGLSFQQMRATLPEAIRESRIKKCIGSLIANKQLEYVDFRCYRVYPSVFNVLDDGAFTEEEKTMLYRRMSGETLEAIATDRGVTRERVRQIIKKKIKYLRTYALRKYNVRFVDEDFYSYLYENYDVEKEVWFDYLGISEKTYGFLVNAYSRGRQKIESALSDPQVNLTLKFKIREYLNRNKIMIDGMLIDAQKAVIEDYALAKLCWDEMSYDAFVDIYNNLLRENGIPFSEKLYNTDEVRRTRANRWAESRLCLWKQGERLRFYNIDAQDYTELLETLNLEGFRDTEISTLKFMNEYPAVMEKYDIRDQYELHNLLKKIVDPKTCHDISFHRQPMIRFGEFDREKAIYEIIEAFSPVSADDLAEYVHSEYGYTKEIAMAGYFQPFMQYYHQGVFSVTFKHIPDNRVSVLKENLPGEFYYISEIKDIYTDLFPGADEEEINHRSLKSIGYTVLGKYALRGFNTAEEFFRDILLRDDVFSITPLNKRYGNIQMYQQVLLDTKRNMDILLFDGDQYIQFRRLAKLGITKEDLINYCQLVFEAVEDETYFTAHSLKSVVSSKLDDLGFDELFYGALLSASGLFGYVRSYGSFILYKGQNTRYVSKDSFIVSLLRAYDSVELDDFIADCKEQYGVSITDRYDITGALSGTDFYYDNIMGKIYRNKSYYYAEFDE